MNKLLVITAIILVFQVAKLTKPSVSVYNQTDDVVYLFSGVSQDGVEPEIEEVTAMMRPVRINIGETAHIRLAYSDLYKPNRVISLGWYRGKRDEWSYRNSGYNTFNITTKPGVCSVTIIIKKDEATIRPDRTIFCYKYLNSASE
ncbi:MULTISPECIES: hypothetical protein [unclassified Enterobacter]|uniref:hypothetical protein n=1 Tax=unclassified Enterobacter TaxID=2608935 RepID=UPI0015C946C6|nr:MULTISPECIES: hypothetical protein [unclassified Enterobacter]MBB3303938.1 hypothetical protein [Enterobacter sp. Sphag1F]NYI12957.1 hypothetical protein [Enterobacter sp. Sphag71]